MAEAQVRRSRTTLLDQLSGMEPNSNLRDLLNARNNDGASSGGSRSAGIVTLASILESEKHGGRTLLDIIREEDEARGSPTAEAEEEPAEARVSLMTLLALADGAGGEDEVGAAASVVGVVAEEEVEGGAAASGAVAEEKMVCCVCMMRRKGAAFIPCGHTFCRMCSRELWTGRGSCPLCNARILDILDIF